MLACHLEQLGGPVTLLPQRHPAAVAARQQQGAGGAFPEPGREQRGAAHLVRDETLHVLRCDPHQVRGQGGQFPVRQPQDETVVGGHGLGIDPGTPLHEGGHRHAPGRQHRPSQRAVHHDPPVTQLVAEPFHHDGPLVRYHPGGLALPRDEGHQLPPGVLVDPGEIEVVGVLGDPAQQLPDATSQFRGAGQILTDPEGQLPEPPRRGGDQHLVARDPDHRPRGGAEREGLTHPGLVDHFLVEFPDPASGAVTVGQEHPVETPVRDGAARCDGEPPGPGQG